MPPANGLQNLIDLVPAYHAGDQMALQRQNQADQQGQNAAMMMFRGQQLQQGEERLGVAQDSLEERQREFDNRQNDTLLKQAKDEAAASAEADYAKGIGLFGPDLGTDGTPVDHAAEIDAFKRMEAPTRRQVVGEYTQGQMRAKESANKDAATSKEETARVARIDRSLFNRQAQEFVTPDLASDRHWRMSTQALRLQREDKHLSYENARKMAESLDLAPAEGSVSEDDVTNLMLADPRRFVVDGKPNREAARAVLALQNSKHLGKIEPLGPAGDVKPDQHPDVMPLKAKLADAEDAVKREEKVIDNLRSANMKVSPEQEQRLTGAVANRETARTNYYDAHRKVLASNRTQGMAPAGKGAAAGAAPGMFDGSAGGMVTQDFHTDPGQGQIQGMGPGANDQDILQHLQGAMTKDRNGNFTAHGSDKIVTPAMIKQSAAQFPDLTPAQRLRRLFYGI